MDEQVIRDIVRSVLSGKTEAGVKVPIEVSARHVHLNKEAVLKLFGAGTELIKKRSLSQTGEFLSEQRVKLVTHKAEIANVAVLGPERGKVQAELSVTDCRLLGIDAPVNLSGDLTGAADLLIVGPNGIFEAKSSAIIARTHIHAAPEDAKRFGLADGSRVRVSIPGKRPVTLDDVSVRVKDSFIFKMHIDVDEANACGYEDGMAGTILGPGHIGVSAAPGSSGIVYCEKLITESMARELIKTHEGEICVSKTAVLTPSAKDVLLHAGVNVRRVG